MSSKAMLDRNGYNSVLAEIASLEAKLSATLKEREGHRFREYTTTAAADDNAYNILYNRLQGLKYLRDNCEIVESAPEQASALTFQIGDIAEIIITMNGRTKPMNAMLVGINNIRIDGVANITLSSPLGKVIYGQLEGASGTYQNNGNTCGYQILKIHKQTLGKDLSQGR